MSFKKCVPFLLHARLPLYILKMEINSSAAHPILTITTVPTPTPCPILDLSTAGSFGHFTLHKWVPLKKNLYPLKKRKYSKLLRIPLF